MSYGTSEGASICQSSAETWEKAKLALSATGIPYPGVEVRVIATDGTAKSEFEDQLSPADRLYPH